MSAGKVYVLISNWNGWRDTIGCLESVFQIAYPDYLVIVRDNSSTDGSEEKIREWALGKSIPFIRYDRQVAERGGSPEEERAFGRPSLVFIQTGENLGYAGGNNVALRYVLARGDGKYIWLLNNDTVVDRDALGEMVAVAGSDEKIGMVGSKLLYYDRPNVLQVAGGCRVVPWMGNASVIAGGQEDRGQWDSPLEPDYLNGASVLVRTDMLKAVGLMEEKYFLYWEDADWGVRARRKGYRLLYCPKSKVWHKEGATTGYLSPRADYYLVRNGLYFIRRFYPHFLPLVPFAYLFKYTVVRALKKQPLNFRSFVSGTIDFLMGKTGPMQA